MNIGDRKTMTMLTRRSVQLGCLLTAVVLYLISSSMTIAAPVVHLTGDANNPLVRTK
jgi:hypothetical protein